MSLSLSRRTFIGCLAFGGLLRTRVVRAQGSHKLYRIGILSNRPASDLVGPQPRSPSVNALLRGLRELGYVYGKHFTTEPRGSEGKPENFPRLAAELLRIQVDVIVAAGPALPALKEVTSTIPVIMSAAPDPVSQGFVQSLAHPGGRFTGFSLQSLETVGKRLELLKDMVPGAAPVGVVWDQFGIQSWQAAEAAARQQAWKLVSLEIREAREVESAFKTALAARASALLVFAAGLLFPNARQVAELALKHRLPAMFELRQYVEAGGLMSYGADIDHIWQRAAMFVDRILKGAEPRNLPIEQPTKFELLINLNTAKTLGVSIPQTMLFRADEVIGR